MANRKERMYCLFIIDGRVMGWLSDPQAQREFKRLSGLAGVEIYRGELGYITRMAKLKKAPQSTIEALENCSV